MNEISFLPSSASQLACYQLMADSLDPLTWALSTYMTRLLLFMQHGACCQKHRLWQQA